MNEPALTNRPKQTKSANADEDRTLFEHEGLELREGADVGGPKLTLVHTDDLEVEDFEADAPLCQETADAANDSDAGDAVWPWVREDTIDIIRERHGDQLVSPDPAESSPIANASLNAAAIDEQNSVEDVAPSNLVAQPPVRIDLSVPRSIGSGKLVPARLTWKPGDPFAGARADFGQRFRWELMLTAACVTSVAGLGCIWLLRTLLA
jgi:hypothetical protein